MLAACLLCALAGYLCGSVPFGFLIGKFNGIDIRRFGSGNIGATNVTRVIGKGWGRACFLLDFLKGLLPVLLLRLWLRQSYPGDIAVWGPIFAAAGSIGGHMWPCWLNFSGGKGVATSIGALLALAWAPIAAAVVVWLVVFASSRYVSLASVCAAIMMPINALIFNVVGGERWHTDWPVLALLLFMALLIMIRHRENIQRLRKGTEHRFVKKSAHADRSS